ncbi:MAG: hypothetical protein ACMUHY_02510, partial [Thermoplasmatota archaeon]
IGDATLHRAKFGWFRHVGEIRLVTHPDYRRKGLGLLLAKEIFFHRMLHFFYRSNAKGTARALSTQWYSKGDLISKIVGEMNDLYNERTESRVVEAIVMTAPRRKRGRPRKKQRKALPPVQGVVAKELR